MTTMFAPTEGSEFANEQRERLMKFSLFAAITVVYMGVIPALAFGGLPA